MTSQQDLMGRLPELPQAFFDEFGRSADDRVQDYARACVEAVAQLPAGEPEYDRELIASMLEASLRRGGTFFSDESTEQQIKLLRAADNRDAEGVRTAKLEDGVPDVNVGIDVIRDVLCVTVRQGREIIYSKFHPLTAAPQPDNKESR